MVQRDKTHQHMVNEFMMKAREEDPERYKEVCAKYPVLSYRKHQRLKYSEMDMGLLGLEPSSVRMSLQNAFTYRIDVEVGERN